MDFNKNIEIHPATLQDAPIITQLGRQTFVDTFGHLFLPEALEAYLNETFQLEKISNSLQKPYNHYFIAFSDAMPVGYVKIKINSITPEIQAERPVQLQKLYVLQDYISKKIGAALMQTILEMPAVQASDLLWLVVLQSNTHAIRFYEKFGFVNHCEYFHTIGANRFEYFILTKTIS